MPILPFPSARILVSAVCRNRNLQGARARRWHTPQPSITMKALQGDDISHLIEATDCWIFDCDGVLWLGNHTIPGVPDVLARLREVGKKTVFVTNNSTKSREQNANKFRTVHGIDVSPEEVVGSAYNAAYYIAHVLKLPKEKKVFVVGEPGLEAELNSFGIQYIGGHKDGHAKLDMEGLEAYTPDPDVAVVLFGLDFDINYTKFSIAMQYLAKGATFLATNDDHTFPLKTKKAIGTGGMLRALEAAAGRRATVLGKPHPPMIDVVVNRFNLEPSRCLMVGDRLNTDIAFGRNGGMKTLLVLTGISKVADVDAPDNDVRPDYFIQSLGDLKGKF